MKKKLFILILATAICGSVFFGENAFADNVERCNANGSNATPKDWCAGSLYRTDTTIADYAKNGNVPISNLVPVIKRYVDAVAQSGMSSDAVAQLKNSYATEVANIMRNNNVDPCAGKTGGEETSCRYQNWKYYYATAPGSTPTPSGGGGGGSSPSSPDSSDDDSSNTEIVDPAPVNEGDCTSILPNAWCEGDDGIQQIIRLIILILTGSVVVAGTVGIIICGFLWMTARENEQQVATAKKRMLDIIIGVVAWVLLALLANLFIPKPSDEIQNNVNGNVSATKDVEA